MAPAQWWHAQIEKCKTWINDNDKDNTAYNIYISDYYDYTLGIMIIICYAQSTY